MLDLCWVFTTLILGVGFLITIDSVVTNICGIFTQEEPKKPENTEKTEEN